MLTISASIIYFYCESALLLPQLTSPDTVVFEQVGITDPTTQTGINAGLNVFTWICQIAFVFVGKRFGRRPILLWIWPFMLVSMAGLCAASGVSATAINGNNHAAVATVVLVWMFLGAFNCSNPVLYSYPAEVQTFSMRSKGLLAWNTVSQLTAAYAVFVDAIALDAIGECIGLDSVLIRSGYKYYPVYMALIIIQWILMWRCECRGATSGTRLTRADMVETQGYTLEEIAQAFDGSSANLVSAEAYLPGQVNHETQPSTPGAEDNKA